MMAEIKAGKNTTSSCIKIFIINKRYFYIIFIIYIIIHNNSVLHSSIFSHSNLLLFYQKFLIICLQLKKNLYSILKLLKSFILLKSPDHILLQLMTPKLQLDYYQDLNRLLLHFKLKVFSVPRLNLYIH